MLSTKKQYSFKKKLKNHNPAYIKEFLTWHRPFWKHDISWRVRLIKPEISTKQVAQLRILCYSCPVSRTWQKATACYYCQKWLSAPAFKSVPTSHMFVEKRKPTCQDVNHLVGLAYSQSSIFSLHCISRYATKFRTSNNKFKQCCLQSIDWPVRYACTSAPCPSCPI